jgi:protein disulfide-isomerase A6
MHRIAIRIAETQISGILKMDSLSSFFDSILDGSVDLKTANDNANAEEFTPDEKELEIERKQEAQRIALAHGGFTDLIDFEKAIKEGHGADYHDIHGYPGMMGQPPKKKKSDSVEKEELPEDSDDGLAEEAAHVRISDEL